MFQNIQGQAYEKQDNEKVEFDRTIILKSIIKNTFSLQKVLVYIICFMLSTIECTSGVAPFAIAILAASYSNQIPTLIIYILTILGTAIGLGKDQTLTYVLTSLIFIVSTLIFKPKVKEEFNNEKLSLGKHVLICVLIVQLGKLIFGNFMIYDLLQSILIAIASYIFYKIFTNSLIVINEFKIKKAFAIEEIIGASIMLAICASALRGFSIFGFELKNILSILIVLVLGWKNGILLGATSGITIGTTIGIINGSEPVVIASYALSGLLAGIFSKFGRIGVIVGFALGNAILAYLNSGNIEPIIYYREMLIASLALLLVPQNIQINVEDLFGKTRLLREGVSGNIEENKQTIFKLNNVSETLQDMADTYKEVAATTVDMDETLKEKNKNLFITEFENVVDELKENIIYEDLSENEKILSDIFDELIENQKITRTSLLDIFAKNNNYIVGFDSIDVSIKLEQDINNAIQLLNETYKISKVNFVWNQKIKENKKQMGEQLDGVSKVISSIAKDIKEQEGQDKFYLNKKEEVMSICKQKQIDLKDIKIKQEVSGRYIITTYLDVCKQEEMEKCKLEALSKILTKVFKEKIVLNKTKCAFEEGSDLCINTFISKDKYIMQLGISKATKQDEIVSGDTYLNIKLEDGKYLLAISDGMGSGANARKESKIAIKMLQRLLTNGFDKDTSIELINSTLSTTTKEDSFATLDIAIIDLYAGNIEFIKNAACPTYIKHNNEVQIVKSVSLPAGILDNINLVVYDKDIEENDIMLMCSDGIMESNEEYKEKELWVKDILEELITDNVQKISDIIKKEAIDNYYGIPKDDMTIMTAKFTKAK